MRNWLAVAAVILGVPTTPAFADRDHDPNSGAPLPPHPHETASPITDHFYIRGTFFDPQVKTNFRVDQSFQGMTGTPVNGESDLGLPNRLHQGRVEFMFRLRERNKVRVDYFEADRSGSRTLAKDVVFGNQTFAAGQLTQTSLDWRQFDITYGYSLLRNDRFEVGTGLGIYFLQVDAIGQVPARNQRQEVTAATPFPALPLDLTWVISQPLGGECSGCVPQGDARRLSRLVCRQPRGPPVPLESQLRHRPGLRVNPHLAQPQERHLSGRVRHEHQRTGGVRALQLLKRGAGNFTRVESPGRRARNSRACARRGRCRD